MTAEEKIKLDEIRKKIEADQVLTSEEEFLYLTKAIGHTEIEANTIITISNNKDKSVVID